jgi:hypothetical protein
MDCRSLRRPRDGNVNSNRRPSKRDWTVGLTAGVVLGAIFLGVGGRVAMRAIALADGRSPLFTLDGSVAVVLFGAIAGAIVAIIFLLARVFFPARRVLRVLFFWMVTIGFVLRGVSPLTLMNVVWFMPLFLAHGSLLNLYWCRVHLARRNPYVSNHAASVA